MTITYHPEIEQGSDEWHDIRKGIITASTISKFMTATGRVANNDTSRRATYELVSERVNGIADETPTTWTMQRGHDDEEVARQVYSEFIAPVDQVGFVTNDRYGFMIGCSPDGLVRDEGGIEVKSRLHSLQIETIIRREVPSIYMAQIQTCLMVTERKWWDFCSFPANGGGKMMVLRVYPDHSYWETLLEAADACEERVKETIAEYEKTVAENPALFYDAPVREDEPTDVIVL